MSNIKALVGLTIIAGTLAITAVPAAAWFEAKSGTGGVVGSGSKPFEFTVGTAVVKCASVEGNYSVRTLAKQEATKLGQHLNIFVSKWNECKFIGLSATVSSFEFQLKQPNKGETKGLTASIVAGGTIKSIGCEITVDPEGNANLGSNNIANDGESLLIEADDTGITEEVKGGSCALAGAESGSKAIFKAPVTIAFGVNEV